MSSWETIGGVKGLSDFYLDYADGGFVARARRSEDTIVLDGTYDTGAVLFHRLTIDSPNITTNKPRLPIGRIRAEVARRIRHDPDGGDYATEVLENWDLRQMSPEEVEWLREKSAAGRAAAHEAKRSLRSTGKLGRPPLDDDFLRPTAELYLELFPENERRIAQATAEVLRKRRKEPGLSINTVKSWINRCRTDGWLEKAVRGKPVGLPGPRLIKWIESHE